MGDGEKRRRIGCCGKTYLVLNKIERRSI